MRFGLRLLAASSLLLAALAQGAVRPQYGGTLRVMTRMSVTSLDPGDTTQADSIFRRDLDRLLFDTLVFLDDYGKIQPGLAVSWKSQPGYRAWEFQLRPDVKFEDGSPLTPTSVATALRAANPNWAVSALADSVLIESETEQPMLPAELAQPKYSIVKRLPSQVLGTGPFHSSDWQAGKSLTIEANEDYWGGRPFVNTIEISFGKTYRDQTLAFQLGRTDLIEVAPEQARRSLAEGRSPTQSAPIELVALVFPRDPASNDERKLRDALAFSIDRAAIRTVLLQGNGQPTGAILPDWMSGYAFLFPAEVNLERARQERSAVRQPGTWTLGFDSSDPLNRLIAERIALNAKEAGLTVQPSATGTDVRLVTIPLASMNAAVALTILSHSLGLPAAALKDSSPQTVYSAEAALLDTQRVIPLFHLPISYGVSPGVHNWQVRRDGTRNLGGLWLAPERP